MCTKYKIGNEVQRVSDPSKIGTVVEICEIHAGVQWYRVNFGQLGRPVVAEPDLRIFKPNTKPVSNLIDGNIDGYAEFQRLITYERLLRDNPLRNNVYAFNASRTKFFPYQFKPLLKFLDSPKHRLLIADEVGLGKTIEAGLILTEMRARQLMKRVLVVCPANLLDKWRWELKRRFGEDFKIMDAKSFEQFLRDYEEEPQNTMLSGIISLESIRQETILKRIEALSPSFDLVIVDEAHHMRNFGRKQRKAGVLLARGKQAMLFLTATPIHLGSENLFSLLNILDEEEFPDFNTVNGRFNDNEPIVKANICVSRIPPNIKDALQFLINANNSIWIQNNPLYNEIIDKLKNLQEHGNGNVDRGLILDIQQNLAELNLIGHIFTRTKKRDVQTNMAVRQAYPIRLRFTKIEMDFYNAVTQFVREQAEMQKLSKTIHSWILITPQRRMASSIPAMVEYYKTNLNLSIEDISEDFSMPDEEFNEKFNMPESTSAKSKLESIIKRWPKDGRDSKYEKFIEILRGIRAKEGRIKIMVFAFFKDTLRYLERRLKEDGFKCALISGDIVPDERSNIVTKFKDDDKYEVLLSSKVGSEGLDFQFCDTLFNYDLPWNPMDVEQRIGRLDRIGQESPVIRIYNFWIEGTIEQRILERLYERIEIFERSIGELEMILGDEFGTIEKDILSKKLTIEEEQKLMEQKAMVIEARAIELENLETKAANLIGADQYFDEEVETIKKCRRYVTGEQMRRFVLDYIKTYCPRTRLDADTKNVTGTLYPDDKLLAFLTSQGAINTLHNYFVTQGRGVPITFDSQTAFEKPTIDFLNVLHPLPQAIVKYYKEQNGVRSNAHHILLRTDKLKPGLYIYFVYRLTVSAARGGTTLEIVILNKEGQTACSPEEAEIILGEMVEKGEDSDGIRYEFDRKQLEKAVQVASEIFHNKAAIIQQRMERNNDIFIDRRLESIKGWYSKDINMHRSVINQITDKKIIRMHESTIRRLESELLEHQQRLNSQRKVGVEYDELAAGILEVT